MLQNYHKVVSEGYYTQVSSLIYVYRPYCYSHFRLNFIYPFALFSTSIGKAIYLYLKHSFHCWYMQYIVLLIQAMSIILHIILLTVMSPFLWCCNSYLFINWYCQLVEVMIELYIYSSIIVTLIMLSPKMAVLAMKTFSL